MNKYLETIGYVAVFLGATLACGKGKSSSSNGAPAPNSGPSEMAVTVEASTLIADYKGNEVRGDAKWKGKRVKVTGVVDDIKKDIMDVPYVTLGTGAMFEIPTVQCSLKNGQESKAATLQKGQKLTMTGRVSGLIMNVQLDDCQILPTVAAAPPPQQPAPQAQPAHHPHPQPHPAAPAKSRRR
jgi:hypothetical protein